MRTQDMTLLYSLSRDGISTLTFYENCKRYSSTLLVILDKDGYKFGGYCTEVWKKAGHFYGTGENFLFTLKDGNIPEVYYWTGESDQF